MASLGLDWEGPSTKLDGLSIDQMYRLVHGADSNLQIELHYQELQTGYVGRKKKKKKLNK